MKQPTKDALREQLALAADRIIALETFRQEIKRVIVQHEVATRPWWRRWFA